MLAAHSTNWFEVADWWGWVVLLSCLFGAIRVNLIRKK